MVNSKCNRHQISIDSLYLTCFLNRNINSKSVDLPKNTMIPATFSTILWRIPTFQNKPAKTEKVCNPTIFDFLEAQGTSKLWEGHDFLFSHLQMGFISYFKIIQGTSIDPNLQICSHISPFFNIYKYDGHFEYFTHRHFQYFTHGHFEYFTPYCTLIPYRSNNKRFTRKY